MYVYSYNKNDGYISFDEGKQAGSKQQIAKSITRSMTTSI